MQIAIAANEIAFARALLPRQAVLDNDAYYMLRKSQVELGEGDFSGALASARVAASKKSGVVRESLVQRAFAEIASKEFIAAHESIKLIKKRYDDSEAIRTILAALILVAASQSDDAMATLEDFGTSSPTAAKFLQLLNTKDGVGDLVGVIQRAYMMEYNTDHDERAAESE